VHADGLTVDEFKAIGQAIEHDPQLRQRVIDMAKQNAPAGAPRLTHRVTGPRGCEADLRSAAS